jgi:hypothetical protein
MENSSWVRVNLEVPGDTERLSLSCQLTPPAAPVLVPHRRHGKPVSERSRTRDRRRRGAWLKRKNNPSISGPLLLAGDGNVRAASLAHDVAPPAAPLLDTLICPLRGRSLYSVLLPAPPSIRHFYPSPVYPTQPTSLSLHPRLQPSPRARPSLRPAHYHVIIFLNRCSILLFYYYLILLSLF